MADIKGILIASQIIPSTDGTILDHATHLSQFGKGGWHEVETISERDAITNDRCEVGMSVYVTSEKKLYILSALDTSTDPYTKTWTLFSTSGVDIMPIPSDTELGNIVQYIGETTAEYTQGYFYKCILNSEDPVTYTWIRINTQPETEIINDVLHTDADKALSANMGKELQDQINNLQGRGR